VYLEPRGVAEDRRIFLLDERGAVVHLRSHPHLVQATPDLDLGSGVLRVSVPDGAASTPLSAATEPVHAHLYGKDRSGRLLPGDVAAALSELAGEPIRPVLADDIGVGWDEGPVSLLGRASAAAVDGDAHDHARYRMLVEVDGTDPFEEDTWVGHEIALGEARVKVTHELVRCVIITQSPQTGAKDWDGLRALAEHGRTDLCLGVIGDVVDPGHVRVGDDVRVLGAF
jgi:hypothetical protein